MPRHCEAALVRSFNHRLQLTGGYVHERFEGRDTLIGPEFNRLASVLRTAELGHGQTKISLAPQIWPCTMDFRARNFASVYPGLQVQVRIGLHTRSGAEARDTSSGIEPWKRESGLLFALECSPDSLTCQVHRLGIKHVIMHPNQPGHYGVVRQVQHLRTRRNRRGSRISNSSDDSVPDNYGLIITGRLSRAVDHADMGESD